MVTYANKDALSFYKSFPFNRKGSLKEEVDMIRGAKPEDLYPCLTGLLRPDISVLEIGCGTGWLSNVISFLYKGARVMGIDFNPVAIKLAKEVAGTMGLETRFSIEDLFLFEPETRFDLVISLGVLHHTNNCHLAVKLLCEKFVRPGGHAMIGLYHKYGRRPFLDYFNRMKKRGASKEEMLAQYRKLHLRVKNETQLISWFMDQVLNPHETRHTLKEMMPILEASGMDLISTSINHFKPIDNIGALYAEEKKYEGIAREELSRNRYFPGFFILLAKKKIPLSY